MFGSLRSWFAKTMERYKSNAMVDIIWMVDVLPHRSNLFWTMQLLMCIYIYGGGIFVYQTQYADGPYEFIKGYVSFSIVMLNGNSSYWFWSKRDLLKVVYSLTLKNDGGVSRKGEYHTRHLKSLRIFKLVVIAFFVFNIVDAWALYMPHRIDLSMDFAMVPCVGFDVSIHPQRELCSLLITYQEVSITNSVLNYQIIILLLISHTSLMYQLLSEEMADIENVSHRDENFDALVAERLTNIINRHVLLLETIARLRDLYTLPIGITFGTNAICIMLFFFVPLNESVKFIPVLFYAVLVYFLYCYLVQKLINGAEAFEIAVYGCGWERFRLKERQLIYNMLVQAQKPVVILAADIVHVNIATFASTVQGLYKFVTVMKF